MRMVKNNIERIAETLDAVECLKAKGYTEVESVEMVSGAKEPIDLSDMDTTHLRVLAKEKGLSGYSSLTKTELLDALKDVV